MKRPRSQPTFTLFPFLAVLMCTMGALILILLVTTRRIRQQAIDREAAALMATAPAPSVRPRFQPTSVVAPVPVPPLSTRRPEHMPPVVPEVVEIVASVGPSGRELAERAYREQLAAREREQRALDAQWEQEIQNLRTQRERLLGIVQNSQAAMEQQRAAQLTAQQKFQQLTQAGSELEGGQAESMRQLQLLQTEQLRAEQALAALQQQQQAATQALGTQRPRMSIVAHDAQSGTNRRPILIECRADGLSFAAEGVTLSAADINGFLPEYNPVRAGAEALIRYWQEVDRAAGKESPEPYVLMVVRPSGTVGFYVARKMLEKLDTPTGYELILDNDEMAWPETDPRAAAVCRAAVQKVLENRTRADAASLGGSQRRLSEEMAFTDSQGAFRMHEVDRMRNVRDPYALSNSDWVSPHGKHGSSAGSATADQRALAPRATADPARQPANASAEFHRNPFAEREQALAQARTGTNPRTQAGGTIVPPAVDQDLRTPSAATNASAQPSEQRAATDADSTNALEAALRNSASAQTMRGTPAPAANPFPEFGLTNNGSDAAGMPNAPQLPPVPSRAIGVEREVILDVWADGISTGEINPIDRFPLDPSASPLAMQQHLARLVEAEVKSWGPAPASFAWRPSIRLVIHPGGNLHVGRLTTQMRTWGLKIHTEQVLE